MVFNRFQGLVDFEKFIDFVIEETKTNAAMKNPEVHAASMGRVMSISAIIECKWEINTKQLFKLVDIVTEVYHSQEFLREAIQLLLIKVLQSGQKSVKLFEHICSSLKISEGKIVTSSSDLSLFLSLRNIYLLNFNRDSKEFDSLMQIEIVGNKKYLQHISALIKTQTYLYPRIHSSASLLVKELCCDQKLFGKNFVSVYKALLEDAIFNEEIYNNMKSAAKMKYLHIGMKMTEQMLHHINTLMDDKTVKISVLRHLLLKFKNFRVLLVRNVQMPKNQLHQVCMEVKQQIKTMLNSLKE